MYDGSVALCCGQMIGRLIVVLVCSTFCPTFVATAQTPLLDEISFVEVTSGLNDPVAITHAGDGSGRLFITEQVGRIRIYDGSRLLAAPFLNISGRVRSGGERGLLSAAFHPDYAANGEFFVNYTDRQGDTVVSRFRVTGDPNVADPNSEQVLLNVAQPFGNHNGGQLQFGPDGYLYIGMGDGGSGGDPGNRAQDLSTVLGKILRIDVDSANMIPPSNPFVGTPGARGEIWAYGVRNPWRFTFDRATGDMFIGDVGQGRREEISFQPSDSSGGANYGWRRMEGSLCFSPGTDCNDGSLVLPILEFGNPGRPLGASITGGYRYRGRRFERLQGVYFYADFTSGSFYVATETNGVWTAQGPRSTPHGFSTFGEDEAGELYFADYFTGTIYRIEAPVDAPSISEGGVVNAASFRLGEGIAPGMLATVFGAALATVGGAAERVPLPTDVDGTIEFEGVLLAPQIFANRTQRNFQVPWELAGRASAMVRISTGGQTSPPFDIPIAPANPGIFVLNDAGYGAVVILGVDGGIAAPLGEFGGSRPIRGADFFSIFVTGLGAVSTAQVTGAPPEPGTLVRLVEPVTVTLGGVVLNATFAGLAPGFVGLYQVNVEALAGLPSGAAVALIVRVAGFESNTVFVAVE